MVFGVIGAGQVALAIARHLLTQGHRVSLSSRRGPSGLAEVVSDLGAGAEAVSVRDAAAADTVILAVPWQEVEGVLKDLPPWNGRILVDTTNPFIKTGPSQYEQADLGGRGSSSVVAAHAPGARVVKAFNSILMTNLEKGPTHDGGRRVLFVSGDDLQAKTEVRDLIDSLGFAAIDLGGLEGGGLLQQGGGPLAGKDLVMLSDWRL